jgi:hypothetical protein
MCCGAMCARLVNTHARAHARTRARHTYTHTHTRTHARTHLQNAFQSTGFAGSSSVPNSASSRYSAARLKNEATASPMRMWIQPACRVSRGVWLMLCVACCAPCGAAHETQGGSQHARTVVVDCRHAVLVLLLALQVCLLAADLQQPARASPNRTHTHTHLCRASTW